MSEFEEEEVEPLDPFIEELRETGVKERVITKLNRIRTDTKLKLYSKEIEAARKVDISERGDIPEHFMGIDIDGREAVRRIMFIGLVNGVLAKDTPMRRMWYQFMKLALQNLVKEFNMYSAFITGMRDMVMNTGLDYKDFNILSMEEGQLIKGMYGVRPKGEHVFPNIMLGIEDVSYYGVFRNMAELLGLHRYSASGQSSLSATEAITDDLKRTIENIGKEYPLNIRGITDYDPAGFNIYNAYLDHFTRFLGRETTAKRFAPYFKHYTPKELVKNMYMVKLSTISQSVWEEEREELEKFWEEYKNRTGVDFRDSNDWYNNAQKLLLKHGSIYEKGVKEGLGKPPRMKKAKDILGWTDTPEELKDSINEFIDTELPRELVDWWENTVKGGAEGARPTGLTNSPIDLFYFVARNKWIFPYGVELASIPERPLEPAYDEEGDLIDDYENPEFIKGSHKREGTGQARMRLLTFDGLIEEFGLEHALKHFINLYKPYASSIAGNFISEDTEEGKEEISFPLEKNRSLFKRINDIIDNWFIEYLKEERDELEKSIQDWIDKSLRKYLDPESNDYNEEEVNKQKKLIWSKLRGAVLNDSTRIYYSFPDKFDLTEYDYDEDFELIIPPEIFEALKPIVEWIECIQLNIEDVTKILEEYEYDSKSLEQDWSKIIPAVRACKFVDSEPIEQKYYDENIWEHRTRTVTRKGEFITVEPVERDKELEEKIDDLETQISNLEEEKEKFMKLWGKLKRERDEKIVIGEVPEDVIKDYEEQIEKFKKNIDDCEEKLNKCSVDKNAFEALLKKCKAEKTLIGSELAKIKGAPAKVRIMMGEEEIEVKRAELYEKQLREQEERARKRLLFEMVPRKLDPFRYWAWDTLDMDVNTRPPELREWIEKNIKQKNLRDIAESKINQISKVYKSPISKFRKHDYFNEIIVELRKIAERAGAIPKK